MNSSANSPVPISIAHLSDLHLTATDDGRRKEDRARNMNANLSRLLRHSAIQEANLVLVTGDVSDRVGLRLLAQTFETKAILHGHTHDNLDRRVGGVRIIGTRDSTVPQKSGLLSYKLYTFYSGSKIFKAEIRRVKGISKFAP